MVLHPAPKHDDKDSEFGENIQPARKTQVLYFHEKNINWDSDKHTNISNAWISKSDYFPQF